MKISEILKRKGLFANDIRQRFKNGQIKLNGEVTTDIDLDIKPLKDEHQCKMWKNVESGIFDAGDFIFFLIKNNNLFKLQLQIFDFESIPNSNLKNDLKKELDNFFIIRFSKKDVILVYRNKN